MDGIGQILRAFGLDPDSYHAEPFGSGLIHATFKVLKDGRPAFILQKLNHFVFRHPEDIAHNINIIGNYLAHHAPGYPFTIPVKTVSEEDYCKHDGAYYRLFPFVMNSHTIDVCTAPTQAWEAAAQFGKFTAVLQSFDTSLLRYTIPGFHDLSWRYQQFEEALKEGDQGRLAASASVATTLLSHKRIVDRFAQYKSSSAFITRVTHHDTKISNVLLDEKEQGICVIDLDTVMPGFFISDVGDMIRTYVSPANEEEQDLEKVVVRKDFLDAILSGYSEHMHDLLRPEEQKAFVYSGEFMIYMQALRFYTDHLWNDRYYGASYDGQNLVRTQNQLQLLKELIRVAS
jgi:Ser/Thr protein kinase RdoA (MazF antagonist)